MSAEGFDDDTQLDETIKKLESDLKKARKKEAADDDPMVCRTRLFFVHVSLTIIQEEPSFPLVDVPDADVIISFHVFLLAFHLCLYTAR